ncbi:hypothetical protein ACQKCU_02345 [Heyndrickxia sporothermodurans]
MSEDEYYQQLKLYIGELENATYQSVLVSVHLYLHSSILPFFKLSNVEILLHVLEIVEDDTNFQSHIILLNVLIKLCFK